MNTIEKIRQWTSAIHIDFVRNYKEMGLRASGNWESQLSEDIKETESGYRITFFGLSYTKQLEEGRRPNTNEKSIRAFVGWAGSTFLAEWVKNKGLAISPYAVAYKIAREGIAVPNGFNKGGLVSGVLTTERIDELLRSVLGTLGENLKSDIKTMFKN